MNNPATTTWDILGHEWAARLLQQHIIRGQVRHAYLFSGPAGVGRRTLALHFAQAINCEQPPSPGNACGVCRTCNQFERLQHPDLSLVQSQDSAGEPETGGTLKVDQIRTLQQSLALTPYAAPFRIALLPRFEEANDNAQNALLKTLEEAPQKVILLLTVDNAASLLPTIVSRCEVLLLRPMPVEDLAKVMVNKWQMEASEARMLAHLSGGRPGAARRLMENPEELAQYLEWVDDLIKLLHANRRERFSYAESISAGKKRGKTKVVLRQILQVWLAFWRDVLVRAAESDAPLINLGREDEIAGIARMVDLSTARACTAGIERSLAGLDAGNPNLRLLVEVLLLDMPGPAALTE